MKLILKSAAFAAVAAMLASSVAAQDAKQAIGARQSVMRLNAFHLGQLGAMAKGEMDYDADRAAAIATSFENLSRLDLSAMWPQGSDNAAMPGETRALPAIWETWPAITDNLDAWRDAVAALAATAGDGQEALQAGVGNIGKACGACHDKYRAAAN